MRASPYDVGVEGESRRGKKDGYDTNMTGRAGKMSSRLSYMGVIGQYKKAMEDAAARMTGRRWCWPRDAARRWAASPRSRRGSGSSR